MVGKEKQGNSDDFVDRGAVQLIKARRRRTYLPSISCLSISALFSAMLLS